jgi:hypothetical protein
MANDPQARRPVSESGFTLVVILVATFVLVVGMLGVLSLLTGALRTTSANNERVGATNVARELVEGTRGLDYDDMTSALVPSRLQAAGLGSGSPWIIRRRGVDYTITAASCTFDDPTDKLAATPPAGVCTPQPAGVIGDSNGEDFRRTAFTVAWREAGGPPRSVRQTTLVVNPSGGLGPRIVSFNPITTTITSNLSSVSVVWTTTPATTLRWTVDDGTSSGVSTGSTSFTTTWNIGTSGSQNAGEILDGAYEISAQPFDDRDIAGEARRADITLNRRFPYAPPSLAGGHDRRAGDWVDLQWGANSERDILGYRVKWAGPDGIVANGDDQQVCPAPSAGTMLDKSATSCADLSPPSGATTYYIVAVDRAPDNQLRDGDRRTLDIGVAGPQPNAPTGPLTVSTVNSQPRLSWNAPSSGSVSFYRIYRDGTSVGFADRYGRTSGTGTTFTDDSPEEVAHQYWVTTVNSSFNESAPIGPVTWSP